MCGQDLVKDGEYIKFSKILQFGSADDGLLIDGSRIFTKGTNSVAITVNCKYAVTATAQSAIIEIEPKEQSTAVLDKIGNLDAGLELQYYTDETYSAPMTDPARVVKSDRIPQNSLC